MHTRFASKRQVPLQRKTLSNALNAANVDFPLVLQISITPAAAAEVAGIYLSWPPQLVGPTCLRTFPPPPALKEGDEPLRGRGNWQQTHGLFQRRIPAHYISWTDVSQWPCPPVPGPLVLVVHCSPTRGHWHATRLKTRRPGRGR